MKRFPIALSLALFLFAAAAGAYVVKLKDGSLVFARMKYEVKGKKAIITLENGTVTQIELDKVDVPGTDEYNKTYSGNVIAIDTPDQKVLNVPAVAPTRVPRLQDLIREKKTKQPLQPGNAAPADADSGSWPQVDPTVQAAFSKVFEGAGIQQYRLSNYRGKVKLLATANNEEAVFNTLSAAARALAELAAHGHDLGIEIVLTTSANESGGTFQMSPEQARLLVNGNLLVADYFVKNVAL